MAKKIWKYIDKLKGKRSKVKNIEIFDEGGNVLGGDELKNKIERFWKPLYRKCENQISSEWNVEQRECYVQELRRSRCIEMVDPGNTGNFVKIKTELLEHFDVTKLKPTNTLVSSEFRPIDLNTVRKILKEIKNNKVAGPDGINTQKIQAHD